MENYRGRIGSKEEGRGMGKISVQYRMWWVIGKVIGYG